MPAWLHPGRSARAVLDGATVGYFGQLHPAEAQRRKIKQTIYIGEIYLDRALQAEPASTHRARTSHASRPSAATFPSCFPHRRRTLRSTTRSPPLGIPELQRFEAAEILSEKDSKLVPRRTHLAAAAARRLPGAGPHPPGGRTARLRAARRLSHRSTGREAAQLEKKLSS